MPKYILLADDSVTIQKVVELTFSEGDYQVTCVSNGKLALQKIQEQRPDILLCDVIMPELNGYEVCSAVKHTPELAGIPVILMTGTFEPFDEDKARQAGADTFVTKPFESKMLVEKVEELLRKRMVMDTTVPVESVQVFSSREEFTLEAPPPSDEAFLAAESAKVTPAESLDSPFLATEAVLHAPVSDALQEMPLPPVPELAPPTVPAPESVPPVFVAAPSAEPLPEGAFEEVFAPPPAIAHGDSLPPPPPTWEPVAPVQVVPPSPAESLFEEEAFESPAAFVEAPAAPPIEEPELPPFDASAPAEPLEVVHDMMDQEQMVAQAQVLEPVVPPPSPFEEVYEQPPMEMPYESVAPQPPPGVPSLEFPDAPSPIEAAPALEPLVFETPISMVTSLAPPPPAPPEDQPGEYLPATSFSPVEKEASDEDALPAFEPAPPRAPIEAIPPVSSFIEAAPQVLQGTPPATSPFEELPAPAPAYEAPEELFGGPGTESSPVSEIPPWNPPVNLEAPSHPMEEGAKEAPPLSAEGILEEIPAVPVQEEVFSFTPPEELPSSEITEPSPQDETPVWEPPVTEEPPPFSIVDAPSAEITEAPHQDETPVWEPPVAEEPPPFSIVDAPSAEITEPPPQDETPVWEPPVAEGPPPFSIVDAPSAEITAPPPQDETPVWEPPAAVEIPPFPIVEELAEAPKGNPFESEAFLEEPAKETDALSTEVPDEPSVTGEAPLDFSAPPFFETQIQADESHAPFQMMAEAAVLEPEPVAPPDEEPPSREAAIAGPTAAAPLPSFSREDLEAAIRKVVSEMAPEIIRQVAWEVIPELAESLIKRRISELESDGE